MLQDGYLHIDISIRIISSVMADCIGSIRLIWRWRACMRLAWTLHCLNAGGYFNLQVWKERPTEEWRLQPLHRRSFWKTHTHTHTPTHTHTLTQSHLVNIGQLFVNLGPSCALLSDVETCKTPSQSQSLMFCNCQASGHSWPKSKSGVGPDHLGLQKKTASVAPYKIDAADPGMICRFSGSHHRH